MAKDDKDEKSTVGETSRNPENKTHSSSEHRGFSSGHERPSEHHRTAGSGVRSGTTDPDQMSPEFDSSSLLTSAALIGVGALLQPELLGGMLLGAGAVYAGRALPVVRGVLRPMLKTIVRAGYMAVAKANEVISEASEDVQDMIAEARTDYEQQYTNGE